MAKGSGTGKNVGAAPPRSTTVFTAEQQAVIDRVLASEDLTGVLDIVPVEGRYITEGEFAGMGPSGSFLVGTTTIRMRVDEGKPMDEWEHILYHEIGHYREGGVMRADWTIGDRYLRLKDQYNLPDFSYLSEMFADAYAGVRTGKLDTSRTGEEMFADLKDIILVVYPGKPVRR